MLFNGSYPFKIGCTSYVIPDALIPNVEFMADKVDDIELVLFESKEIANLPDKATIASLQQIGQKEHITYSIHFPIDLHAGTPVEYERKMFIECVTAIISSTSALPVSGYLLHFEGLTPFPSTEEYDEWHKRITGFCVELTNNKVTDSSMICIENLNYPPELHADVVKQFRFSHCIDFGHLWLQHNQWETYANITLPSTKIIHLHGVDNDRKDHRSLVAHNDNKQLNILISLLKKYTGVLTFEVFSKQDTFESFSLFETLWQKLLL